MIKYTNQKDKFLTFNTIRELKEYLVNQWYGLISMGKITFIPIDAGEEWKDWKYVCATIRSPRDGRMHIMTIGIAEIGIYDEG